MAAAHVCDVCGGTIGELSPRTVLTVESAIGQETVPNDVRLDICEKCRSDQAEAVVQAITTAVVKLRRPSKGASR